MTNNAERLRVVRPPQLQYQSTLEFLTWPVHVRQGVTVALALFWNPHVFQLVQQGERPCCKHL